MADYLERILPKMQLPASVALALFGGCLFLDVITPLNIPKLAYDVMITYVALNSLAAPFALRSRFITPKILNPKCPFCQDVYMDTIKLKCPKCGRVAGEEK